MLISKTYTKLFQVVPISSKVKTMAAAEPDYYELLGVSKGATLQEIRAEFRILETRCKRWLYGVATAEDHFRNMLLNALVFVSSE